MTATLASTAAADARTFEVTRLGDPPPGACTRNHCSLREAVQAANARPGADEILLPNRRRQYKLTIAGDTADDARDGDLDVANDPLVIRHPGRGRATIRGIALGDRLFDVFAGAPLRLAKLRLTGGAVPLLNGSGGAIRSAAPVVVNRSRLSGNRTQDADGGALAVAARLVVKRSVLAANSSATSGGAIIMLGDEALRIVRSTLTGNEAGTTAGAIRSGEGPITIIRSRLLRNRAASQGGAMRLSSNGPARITKSTISGNRSGDEGGGIQNDGENTLSITSSTISGNFADDDGGGIQVEGSGSFPMTIVNSTIANNRALDFGGGLFAAGAAEVRLNAVTVVRNHGAFDDEGALAPGGGIFRNTTGTFSVRNSLLALNLIGADRIRNDCAGEVGEPFDSLGHNLLSTLNPAGLCNGFDEPGDIVRSRPKLGRLKRNGGPTKTVALKRGSPAIGRAHRPSAPNRDQRGRRRGNDPDIGAFERGA